MIRVEALARRFEAIAPLLLRYPAIDPDAFRAKVSLRERSIHRTGAGSGG